MAIPHGFRGCLFRRGSESVFEFYEPGEKTMSIESIAKDRVHSVDLRLVWNNCHFQCQLIANEGHWVENFPSAFAASNGIKIILSVRDILNDRWCDGPAAVVGSESSVLGFVPPAYDIPIEREISTLQMPGKIAWSEMYEQFDHGNWQFHSLCAFARKNWRGFSHRRLMVSCAFSPTEVIALAVLRGAFPDSSIAVDALDHFHSSPAHKRLVENLGLIFLDTLRVHFQSQVDSFEKINWDLLLKECSSAHLIHVIRYINRKVQIVPESLSLMN